MDKELLEILRKAGCAPEGPEDSHALVNCLETVLKNRYDGRRQHALAALKYIRNSVNGANVPRIDGLLAEHDITDRSLPLYPSINTPRSVAPLKKWKCLLKELPEGAPGLEINAYLKGLKAVFSAHLQECRDPEEAFYKKYQSFFQEVLSDLKGRILIHAHEVKLTEWIREADLVELWELLAAAENRAEPEVWKQLHKKAMELYSAEYENKEVGEALSLATEYLKWRKQFDNCLKLIAKFEPQKDCYYPWPEEGKVVYIKDFRT